MSFNEYLIEALSLNFINYEELIEIMENFKNNEKKNLVYNPHISKIIDEMEEQNFSKLKGKSLLLAFINLLKKHGLDEDSEPIKEISKRYGSQVIDFYVRSDPEAPAFIRKGVNF